MHNRHCDLQGPDGGCGQEVWEGSGIEGVAKKCGSSGMEGVAKRCGRGQGWKVWPRSVGGSWMEDVGKKCGRVRDGGCGQEVWEGHGWRVCYTAQAAHLSSYPSYTTLHDHDNDNNHTVTHDLFRFLDTYTQLMQVQLYNNAYTK